jgi:signal transduction histidine kinase
MLTSGPDRRFVSTRCAGLLLIAGMLQLNASIAGQLGLGLAAAIVLGGVIALIQARFARDSPQCWIAAALDALANVALVILAGGFGTPLFLLLPVVAMSVAQRSGLGPGLLAGGLAALAAAAVDTSASYWQAPLLLLAGAISGYIGRRGRQADAAFYKRVREGDALNAATAQIGASLEFEPLLRALIDGASHLFDDAAAYLQPAPSLGDRHLPEGLALEPAEARPGLMDELRGLATKRASGPEGDEAVQYRKLSDGSEALVLAIAISGRGTILARLAMANAAGGALPAPADDVIGRFVQRAALALENSSLYHHLAGRGDDLRRAYADLAAAHEELVHVDETKTTFLANVSHEIRTPLTSIRSFSELLLTYEEIGEIQREFLTIINSESERLTRMVNDMLEITKMEAGTVDWRMERFDLGELLREAARSQAPLAEAKNLRFVLDLQEPLPAIYADRDRLLQVITNLSGNALKFTSSGSITLCGRAADGQLEIAVSDTGIGIAPEDRERIFEKFQQIGSHLTEKPRGTGLGLSISREIVEHHDGRIWVESTPGEGSTFAFTLPLTKVAEAPGARVSGAT